MGIFDFFLKRKPKETVEQPSATLPAVDPIFLDSFSLDCLESALAEHLIQAEHNEIPLALTVARFADIFRAADRPPPAHRDMLEKLQSLSEDVQKRASLMAALLRDVNVREEIQPAIEPLNPGTWISEIVIPFVEETSLLTMPQLTKSTVRKEEFCRKLLLILRLSVTGEEAEASKSRLFLIDYNRLMKEAKEAEFSATERRAYLDKLEEEAEAARPRRGKW